MGSYSRRAFLVRSSMVAAAAGAASTLPGITSMLGAAQTEAPAADGVASEVADAGLGAADASAPLVAQVRDLSTGEVGVFNGLREVIVRDPQLANSILRAAR